MVEENREKKVHEERKKLKKVGFHKYFIVPLINHWKEEPYKAITTFLFWFLGTYLVFCSLQAIYFDTIYCDSSDNQYDGRMMEVYNPYIQQLNEKTEEYNKLHYWDGGEKYEELQRQILEGEEYIACNFNITHWKQDKGHLQRFTQNLQTIAGKQ